MTAAAFFSRTYDEAMELLVEARNYLAYVDPASDGSLAPEVRLAISFESMRMTTRLTQVMAWLLTQKAVHAGELTREQAASDDNALAAADLCLDRSGEDQPGMPPALCALLERSHQLYLRVARLDDMFRRGAA